LDDEIEKIRERRMKDMMEKMNKPDKPIELDDRTLGEAIREHPLLLVDFWAVWCPPCKIVAPVLEELAGELKGRVVFGKVDVGNNRSAAAEFGISAIPTLIVFSKGEQVDRIMGAVPKEHIMEVLKKYIE
jgi:thioredoxin 1